MQPCTCKCAHNYGAVGLLALCIPCMVPLLILTYHSNGCKAKGSFGPFQDHLKLLCIECLMASSILFFFFVGRLKNSLVRGPASRLGGACNVGMKQNLSWSRGARPVFKCCLPIPAVDCYQSSQLPLLVPVMVAVVALGRLDEVCQSQILVCLHQIG